MSRRRVAAAAMRVFVDIKTVVADIRKCSILNENCNNIKVTVTH